MERRRAQGRRADLRRRPPRPDQPAEHGRPPGIPPRRRLPAARSTCSAAARRSCSNYGKRGDGAGAAGEGRPVRLSRTAARPAWAASSGLQGPGAHGPQGQGRERRCASGSTADPSSRPTYGAAWDKIAAAQKVAAEIAQAATTCSSAGSPSTRELFQIARTLVRLAEETAKPNAERLREYRDVGARVAQASSSSPTRRSTPSSRRPSSPTRSAFWTKSMPRRPAGRAASSRGQSPEQAAAELVNGTKLADVAVRKTTRRGRQRRRSTRPTTR